MTVNHNCVNSKSRRSDMHPAQLQGRGVVISAARIA